MSGIKDHTIKGGNTKLRRQTESKEHLLENEDDVYDTKPLPTPPLYDTKPLPPIPGTPRVEQITASIDSISARLSAASLLPSLGIEEEVFFNLVESGNIEGVNNFLKKRTSFNLNCRNHYGYTALVSAARKEDIPMVSFLLSYESVFLGDVLFHAITTRNRQLVEVILDRRNSHTKSNLQKLMDLSHQSADFTSDMTPLILAAHCDDFGMVKMLIRRGHTMDRPHPPNCLCEARCKKRELVGESLSGSMSRYNKYRAWASPSFIALTSSDPILTSFRLSEELELCADTEREFKKLYLALADQVRQYAVDLLAECRTSREVSLLLSRRGGDPSGDHRDKFPRVRIALDTFQSDFLAHPNAQQVMRAAWLDGFHDWRSLGMFSKLLRLLPHMFFLPILSIIYILAPNSTLSLSWRTPLNKFFSFVCSYIIFLIVLIAHPFLPGAKADKRGAPNTGCELFMVLYVTGIAWMNIKLAWNHGLKWYFMYRWHVFDMVTIILFYATFSCWVVSDFMVKYEPRYSEHAKRHEWDQYDPKLLGESFYAWACLFALLRLMFFFQISNTIGPLQVSLGRMIDSIMVFMVIFMLFLVAFAFALFLIYHDYKDEVRKAADGTIAKQETIFSTVKNSINTLYWSLYGYYPPYWAYIIVRNHTELNEKNETVSRETYHNFTEYSGQIMFAIYYGVAIIILINVLIAMLSYVFGIVQANDDVEWKFARCQVWMKFFHHGATLPPPFNLIPSPKSFIKIIMWFLKKPICCGRIGKSAKFSIKRCCYFENSEDEEENNEEYKIVMSKLVQRYLTRKGRENYSRSPTVMDLEAVKHELKEMNKKRTA